MPKTLLWAIHFLAPGHDRQVLGETKVRAILAASFQGAARQGPKAAVQELQLAQEPWWEFLKDISLETSLWHGDQDVTVPVEVGRLTEAMLPRCRTHYIQGEGHFSLPVRFMEDILSEFQAV